MKCNRCQKSLDLINIRTKWTVLGDKVRQEALCDKCHSQPERLNPETPISLIGHDDNHRDRGCDSLTSMET